MILDYFVAYSYMLDSSPISKSCMCVYLQDLDIADMVHTEAKLSTRPELDV